MFSGSATGWRNANPGAPEPRVTFLRSFESQIIGAWRREVIRLLFNQVAPDTTGTTEVAAVTPQGLRRR